MSFLLLINQYGDRQAILSRHRKRRLRRVRLRTRLYRTPASLSLSQMFNPVVAVYQPNSYI